MTAGRSSPVVGLDGVGVGNLGPLVPVVRLGVFGIVDLFGGVDRRNHVLQQVAAAHWGLIDEHLVAVVRIQDCIGAERCC